MKEFFRKIFAFLNRDIRLFFNASSSAHIIENPSAPNTLKEIDTPTLAAETPSFEIAVDTAPLPLLLNPEDLVRLALRRQIVVWRRDSILNIYHCAANSLDSLSTQIESKMKAAPFFRKIFPKRVKADLHGYFERFVQSEIELEYRKIENSFNTLSASFKHVFFEIQLTDDNINSQLDIIEKIRFKPSKEKAILEAYSKLVHGEKGIVEIYGNKISEISQKILGAHLRA